MNNQPKVLFAIGPGDVVQAYRDWASGIRTSSETSRTFSGQTLDFCREAGAKAWLISSFGTEQTLRDGDFIIENRPKQTQWGMTGLKFHAVQMMYALSLLRTVAQYRPTLMVADSGTTHWFMLTLVRLLGVPVVPNFHNVYYPVTTPPAGAVRRAIKRLDGLFFRRATPLAIGVSPECGRQYREIAGANKPFEGYYCQFKAEDFRNVERPATEGEDVFRILFVGRVERNKGALDLADIAERLSQRSHRRFCIEVCGAGGALDELQAEVASRQLGKTIITHGRLQRSELLPVYRRSHVVIVPTRSDFTEGLPMVCAEAVLMGRPVVTSKLSNALDALKGAIVEAQPNDIDSYVHALVRLMEEPDLYEASVAACARVSERFVDPSLGLDAALHKALNVVRAVRS